jgi:hypothetical protein
MWEDGRETILPSAKYIASPKKTMASADFPPCDVVPFEFPPQGQTHGAEIFAQAVLPTIDLKLAERCPKLPATAAQLHTDNATPLISKTSIQKIEQLGFVQVPQAASSR